MLKNVIYKISDKLVSLHTVYSITKQNLRYILKKQTKITVAKHLCKAY